MISYSECSGYICNTPPKLCVIYDIGKLLFWGLLVYLIVFGIYKIGEYIYLAMVIRK